MGGNAFTSTLAHIAVFPRLPPNVYLVLKARLLPRMGALFTHAAVPSEAPQKTDHGDLDFVVNAAVAVPHEDVQRTLGAEHVIFMPGNRTSHYAVPLSSEEWPEIAGSPANDLQRYVQVDVHVCADYNEWERIMFMHGYGDLGMIVGSMAWRNGLKLSTKGLLICDPPNPRFELSTDLSTILAFLGLSLAEWKAGFATQEAAFEWAAKSRFFNTGSRSDTQAETQARRGPDRKMLHAFTDWAKQQERNSQTLDENARQAIWKEALTYFGRGEAFEASRTVRKAPKASIFSGNLVGEWTGYTGRWKQVKLIMDAVRKKLGGMQGVTEFVHKEGEAELRRIVKEVTLELQSSIAGFEDLNWSHAHNGECSPT